MSSTNIPTDGYRAPQVCKIVGISYRQLDYWARTGLIVPSLQAADGSGSLRLYSFLDLVRLRVVKRLRATGVSLAKIRKAVDWLRAEMPDGSSLHESTLLSDGIDIWLGSHPAETQHHLMNVLRRGQGVFAIAVGQVRDDLVGETVEMFPPVGGTAEQSPGQLIAITRSASSKLLRRSSTTTRAGAAGAG